MTAFDLWALAIVAAFGLGLSIRYVRRYGRRGASAVLAALSVHTLFVLWFAGERPPVAEPARRIEFEVAREPATPPEPPPLDPAAEPPPEPQIGPTPPPPPPAKRQPRPRREPRPAQSPSPGAQESKPLAFDVSQTVASGGTGVIVPVGPPSGGSGGTGRPSGAGGSAPATTQAPAATAAGWNPTSAAFIDALPVPLSVPQSECPATRTAGIAGTVVLQVQVRHDGRVRKATVVEGIGHGCDEIAARALRGARFTPARSTRGAPADYELRFEYVYVTR